MAKVSLRTVNDHGSIYTTLMFICPGCAEFNKHGLHMLPVNSPNHHVSWEFNGDLILPTLTPSILTRSWQGVCHSFLTDGVFHFLDDSTHSLAGKYIPIPDLAEWMDKE